MNYCGSKPNQPPPLSNMILRPFDSSEYIRNKLQFSKQWNCEDQECCAQQECWGTSALWPGAALESGISHTHQHLWASYCQHDWKHSTPLDQQEQVRFTYLHQSRANKSISRALPASDRPQPSLHSSSLALLWGWQVWHRVCGEQGTAPCCLFHLWGFSHTAIDRIYRQHLVQITIWSAESCPESSWEPLVECYTLFFLLNRDDAGIRLSQPFIWPILDFQVLLRCSLFQERAQTSYFAPAPILFHQL